MNIISENPFLSLNDYKYISLKTFYESGRGVATPVEFAEKDDKLYVNTRAKSWKVKRIEGNPNATIAPCTIRGKLLGEEMDVTVKILSNDLEVIIAKQSLDKKFNKGFNEIALHLFGKIKILENPRKKSFSSNFS